MAERLQHLCGVEVHAGIEHDKLVVTIEDTPESLAADTLGLLNQVQGVINTVLIYHYGASDLSAPAGDIELPGSGPVATGS